MSAVMVPKTTIVANATALIYRMNLSFLAPRTLASHSLQIILYCFLAVMVACYVSQFVEFSTPGSST